MDSQVKKRHEEFHRGHSGGSYWEVVALTVLLQLSHILFSSFLFACPTLIATQPTKFGYKNHVIRWCLDAVCILAPFTIAVTVGSNHVYAILALVLIVICANFWFYIRRHSIDLRRAFLNDGLATITIQYPTIGSSGRPSNRLSILTHLMSCLLLATCIAIFAVDFRSFDRRFAKTELYGWSLMDVGVGGFIAMNGVLSPESRQMEHLGRFSRIWKSIKSSFPMFVLGLIRLVSVKSLNYQEHITEYGVHWNFFFTICFTKIFASTLCALFGTFNTATLGLTLGALYQAALTLGGLTEILVDQNRNGLLAANKEGLASLVGSVALYLIFVQYGRKYLPKRVLLSEFVSLLWQLIQTAGGATLFMFGAHTILEPTSRRETNLAFIFYMIAFITALIAVECAYFAFCQYLRGTIALSKAGNINSSWASQRGPPSSSSSATEHSTSHRTRPSPALPMPVSFEPTDPVYDSVILQSLGPTGLAMFLVANLLTGGFNLVIDTLSITSNITTFAILFTYELTLVFFCRWMYSFYFSQKILTEEQEKLK